MERFAKWQDALFLLKKIKKNKKKQKKNERNRQFPIAKYKVML